MLKTKHKQNNLTGDHKMSKYHIEHKCGHTATHNIYGTNVNDEREERADWLSLTLCRECYKKEQQERAVEANKGLPELTGSDTEIAWSQKLRADAAKKLNEVKEFVDANYDKDPTNGAKMLAVIESTLNETVSKFWIDNRGQMFDRRWVVSQINK